MRNAFDSNKNQSVNTPLSINKSIIFLLVSKLSNITASISPRLFILIIFGCFNNDKKSFSLEIMLSIIFSSIKTFIAASPAAQETGWPPKVLICPKTGLCESESIIFLSDTNAPKGIPPPNALPNNKISGTIPNCSKAHIVPFLPKPH